jgi:hypothetical protein
MRHKVAWYSMGMLLGIVVLYGGAVDAGEGHGMELLPFSTGCRECKPCGEWGHKLVENTGNISSRAHDCDYGGPCGDHPVCGEDPPEFATMETARRALLAEDMGSLREFLASAPEVIRYNAGRRALQFIGCDGTIVAHFPVQAEHGRLLLAD